MRAHAAGGIAMISLYVDGEKVGTLAEAHIDEVALRVDVLHVGPARRR